MLFLVVLLVIIFAPSFVKILCYNALAVLIFYIATERTKRFSNKKLKSQWQLTFKCFFFPYYYVSFEEENENYTSLPTCFSAPF